MSSTHTETVTGLDSGTTYWVTGGRVNPFYTQWSGWQAVTTTGGASIRGARFTSSPAQGDAYRPGETIRAQVTWSQPVRVSTGGSNANVFLRLGLTNGQRKMAYVSGSGTDTLTFEYTVQTGDQDPNGALLLPGASGELVFLENRAAIRGGNPASNAAALTWSDLLWSATLTVQNLGPGVGHGCVDLLDPGHSRACGNALDDNSFNYGGVNYQIVGLGTSRVAAGAFQQSIEFPTVISAISREWTLHVGDRVYAFADATIEFRSKARWSSGSYHMPVGERVSVSLVDRLLPPSPHRVDGTLYIDYDTDDDGLIEIATAAQLNALRWDADGDGAVGAADQANYARAFPDPVPGMGCPDGDDADTDPDPCRGYEIGPAPSRTALDIDLDVAPYNQGEGWVPIPSYSAILEGNGNTASGLFINKFTNNAGLFHTIAEDGQVRNLGLVDVDITDAQAIGALAAVNNGLVVSSYSTGRINGRSASGTTVATIGGLVGHNFRGEIRASYSSASLTLGTSGQINIAGGLVGLMETGEIVASYATGSFTLRSGYGSARRIGGLVGDLGSGATVSASYATGGVFQEDESDPAPTDSGGLVGDSDGTVTDSYYDRETTGQSDGADWSATLTIQQIGGDFLGCTNSSLRGSDKCSSALSGNSFTFEGVNYQVEGLVGQVDLFAGYTVDIALDKALPTTAFAPANRRPGAPRYQRTHLRKPQVGEVGKPKLVVEF